MARTKLNGHVKENSSDGITDAEGTFHGGFVRDRGEGRGVRVAMAKPDELAVPDARTVQEAALALEASQVAGGGKSPLRVRKTALAGVETFGVVNGRKTKLAVMGLSIDELKKGVNPRYLACIKQAKAYRRARSKELYQAYGYVSSGVSALLSAASLALAGSRFLYEAAASSEEPGSVIKQASSLADSARQNELSAWELCARESVIYNRNKKASEALPWEVKAEVVSTDGTVKRGRGRPRKDAGQLRGTTEEDGSKGTTADWNGRPATEGQGGSE